MATSESRLSPRLLPLALILLASPELAATESTPSRGLVATFFLPDHPEPVDARVERLAALRVEEGRPATPWMPPGPFEVRLRGLIEVEFFDDYTFSLEGSGRVRISVDGEVILEGEGEDLTSLEPETIELEERHELEIIYRSPASGPSSFRLLWASLDFEAEPVSPTALSHDPAEAFLRERQLLRRGRDLLARRHCLKCHRPGNPPGERSLPELGERPPILEGIGFRLRPSWIARWLEDPAALSPRATMPAAFHSLEAANRRTEILDLTASLVAGAKSERPLEGGRPGHGRTLFETLGCQACHVAASGSAGQEPDDGVRDEADRISLAHVARKWKPGALAAFLEDPRRFHPSTRMPSFRLSAGEARDLAAWLLSTATPSPGALDLGLASSQRGNELLSARGCLACHDPENSRARLEAAPPFEALGKPGASRRGCLSTDRVPESAPDFGLTETDREALRAILADGRESLDRENAVEYARRRIRDLRCTSCHDRDGVPSLLSAVEGTGSSEPAAPSASGEKPGKLLQTRPLLTWTGEKLTTDWLEKFLAGRNEKPVRPWIEVRMPDFDLRADLFARGLAREHGVRAGSEPPPAVEPEMASVGSQLVNLGGGFSCRTCHDLGEEVATGVFDAKGPDLLGLPERLRHDFYLRWMRDPLRVDPRTKMPQFATDNQSPFVQFYGGDARQQFEAIWQYLRSRAR